MLLTIGFTVAAEDVRHFQLRAIQGARRLEELRRSRLDLHRNRTRQQIQWARCRAHFAGRDVQIFCGSGQAAMAEQELNLANVGARFKQVTCKGMAHGMRCDRFRNLEMRRAFRHIAATEVVVMCWSGAPPGKSQWLGLSIRHQARKISNSLGESIT